LLGRRFTRKVYGSKFDLYLTDKRHDNSLKDEEITALAAYGACCTARYCSRQAFAKHKRAMQAKDMLFEVGNAYQVLFERFVT
jgi:hypothetical protein